MSFTWKLNSRHDLSINRRGQLETVYGEEEVKQRILVSLRHFYQEYFLNVPNGVPWYESILGSKNKKAAESIIRRKILEVPNVVGIAALTISSESDRTIEIFGSVEVLGFQGSLSVLAVRIIAEASPPPVNEFASTGVEFAGVHWSFASL